MCHHVLAVAAPFGLLYLLAFRRARFHTHRTYYPTSRGIRRLDFGTNIGGRTGGHDVDGVLTPERALKIYKSIFHCPLVEHRARSALLLLFHSSSLMSSSGLNSPLCVRTRRRYFFTERLLECLLVVTCVIHLQRHLCPLMCFFSCRLFSR